MLYYLVYIFLALLSIGEVIIIPKNVKKWTYICVVIILILLGGLRWNTGADWRPYSTFFTRSDFEDPEFMLAMESGFALFVRFLRIFSNNFTLYLIALSVLCISFKAIFFYRYTKVFFMALLLFWGTALGDIVAVRQALAISLCLVSTIFIIDKKPTFFILFVLLATQIHVTAIIFLVSYFIFYTSWTVKSKYYWLIFAVIFGLTVGSEALLQSALRILPDGFGFERITGKAEAYMRIGNEVASTENVSKAQRTIAAVLKRAILLPIFFIFQKQFSDNKNYQGFLNLYTFGNVLYFIVIDFLTLQRMATYFYFFEIMLFCIIFENVKSKSVWLFIVLAYSLLKLTSLVLSGYDLLVPYIWIFSSDTYRFIY